ncbi:hypothetical protein, partial [Dissulfuribacter thermophilus]|uniref:hypothetical protein n=1 Tax=Dissulfuribacter thermophilus TaxID=1156395 RepID=UPI0011466E6A
MKSPLVRYGILIIIWIAWYSLFYSNLNTRIQENETQISTLKIQLSSLEKEKKRLEEAAKTLGSIENRLSNLKKRVIDGADPQVVASNLQNLILTYASQKGIEVLTYRTSSSTKWKGYSVARTTFTFKCNKNNFVELLRFFGEQKKLIRPSRLNIVWIRGRNAHIRVILDVEALII